MALISLVAAWWWDKTPQFSSLKKHSESLITKEVPSNSAWRRRGRFLEQQVLQLLPAAASGSDRGAAGACPTRALKKH